MNAYLGKTAAGATWPPPWRDFQIDYPKEAAELQIAWETPPLINNAVMVRDDVPAEISQQIRTLLAGLQDTEAGQNLLNSIQTSRFPAASDQDYQVVRDYIARFEQEVRMVEQK